MAANPRVDMPMRSLSGRKTDRLAILAVAVALFLWGLVIALGDGFIIHTEPQSKAMMSMV
jgi:hypothetical protein